jgi:hypothetical protein
MLVLLATSASSLSPISLSSTSLLTLLSFDSLSSPLLLYKLSEAYSASSVVVRMVSLYGESAHNDAMCGAILAGAQVTITL